MHPIKAPIIPAHQIRPEYQARVANMYMPPEYTAEQVNAARLRMASVIQEGEDEEKRQAAQAATAASAAGMGKAHPQATPRTNSVSLALPLQRVMSKDEQASVAVAYSKKNNVPIVQALKTLGFAA